MKKGIVKTILIGIIICIGCLKVRATAEIDDPEVDETINLFTICDKNGENCQTVSDADMMSNRKYDLFEIKDKEIYLNNAEINLTIHDFISNKKTEYKIHISGKNVISYLSSLINNPWEAYSHHSWQDRQYIFVPISIEGNGTLEIERINQIKRNSSNEAYYKLWTIEENECVMESSNTKSQTPNIVLLKQVAPLRGIKSLTEATVNDSDKNVIFSTPSDGYTVSDIKGIFSNNIDSFYIAEKGSTMSLREFAENPPKMLKNYASKTDDLTTVDNRVAFINTLLNNQRDCTYFLYPSELTFEDAQITASWGNEYINTELPRRFSKTGSYLINVPEEKEMITTTHKDNITFISTEEFDPNYHLVVDDITEKITDIQSASVQAKTDKVLVELYDIYMADQNDNIVKMEDGTYTIKVELNDTLKKYKDYQVIYISEENTVELIDAKVEGDYIVFNTTHLSKYGIVGREIKTGNIVNPNTADSLITYGLILASLAVAIALVLVRINKLKKAN